MWSAHVYVMFTTFDRLGADLQKCKNHKLNIVVFWLVVVDWWTKKNLDLGSRPLNHAEKFLKILPITSKYCAISRPSFMTKWFIIPQNFFEIFSTSCTHHDVTTFEIDGISQD